MMRECIKNRVIHNYLLSYPEIIRPLFTEYAFSNHFDICSDVLQVIRDLLRQNKSLVASALAPNGDLYHDV